MNMPLPTSDCWETATRCQVDQSSRKFIVLSTSWFGSKPGSPSRQFPFRLGTKHGLLRTRAWLTVVNCLTLESDSDQLNFQKGRCSSKGVRFT